MSIGGIIAIILGVLVLLLLVGVAWWIVSTNNVIATKRSNMLDSFNRLDKLLRQRYTDISACIEAMGAHCDEQTKVQVLNARNLAMQNQDLAERVNHEAKLELALQKLLMIYEENKSAFDTDTQDMFTKLSQDIDFIDYERQFYNALASSYNLKIVAFPGNLFAKKKKWDTQPLFILQTNNDTQTN